MRRLACAFGIVLAIPLLVLVGFGFGASYSPSGWILLIGAALVAAGGITAPWRVARRRGLTRAGLALLVVVPLARVVLASWAPVQLPTLPGGTGNRWLGRLVDEQDGSLIGARGILWTWRLPPAERAQLLPAMHDAFVAMRESEGLTPSPVLDTLSGRQSPGAFDAIVIPPHGEPGDPEAAVVFLHGYAGSFTLECWMVAEAARAIHALTICPATGFAGQWWTHDGEETLRATLAYLRQRHIDRIYLAGLSNGGIGASRIAPRFARSLAGLILISGASPDGSTGGLPTLVVQGEGDTSVSAAVVHSFANRTGSTYVGLDGGHFVMMVRRAEVRDTIASWLRSHPAAR